MRFLNKKTGRFLDVAIPELIDFLSKNDSYIAIKNDDGEHWITLHGGDGEGTHILISGEGKVIGGAAGALDGKMLKNVKSKSKNVEKHGAPIPQNPPRPTTQTEPAAPAPQTETPAEPPKEAPEPPKETAAEPPKETPAEPPKETAAEPPKEETKSEPTPQENIKSSHDLSIEAVESLDTKAKNAKTPDEILEVMKEAKDLYTYFRENWRKGDEQEQMKNRERYVKSADMYNKMLRKYKSAKKKIADAPAFETEKDKQLQSKFAKTSVAEISSHFQDKYGLGFENGSNHERVAKKLWSEYLSTRKTGDHEKAESLYSQYNQARALARSQAGGNVRSHTSYDIDDNSAGAKAVRKNLGYVDAALSSLDAGGFDLKAAMSRANVKFAAGGTGKALGHAWQDRATGSGYFSISVSQPINGSAEQMRMAQRRKERGDPLFTISSGTDDVARATIVHELAHALGMNKDLDSPGKLQKTLTGLFPDIRERREWIKKNLSEYATTNYKETDAELAALVTAPYYVRGTLPKQLEDHVDWLFMKRKE